MDVDAAPIMLDASMARKSDSIGQAMQNDAYYRDVNASRIQAQHESVTARNQQTQGTAQSPSQDGGMSRSTQPPGSTKALSGLLDDASISTMRSAMQTDPAAAAKLAQQQQQRQQAVINRERQRREQQRQQQARLKAQEAVTRANQREHEADHHKEPGHHDDHQPPVGNSPKKGGGVGR
jgi:hypothetical protein